MTYYRTKLPSFLWIHTGRKRQKKDLLRQWICQKKVVILKLNSSIQALKKRLFSWKGIVIEADASTKIIF